MKLYRNEQEKGKIVNFNEAAVLEENNMEKKRKVPNPYGKKGSPEHQKKVEEVSKDMEKRKL